MTSWVTASSGRVDYFLRSDGAILVKRYPWDTGTHHLKVHGAFGEVDLYFGEKDEVDSFLANLLGSFDGSVRVERTEEAKTIL